MINYRKKAMFIITKAMLLIFMFELIIMLKSLLYRTGIFKLGFRDLHRAAREF